jgi:hypothetical protein
MRHVHTAPLETFSPIADGPFELEPFEAGWATEAIAFVYVHEVHGPAPSLTLRGQIAADGERWIDRGPVLGPITKAGSYFLALDHFGNWLRLAGEVTGGPGNGEPTMVADVYWVLK